MSKGGMKLRHVLHVLDTAEPGGAAICRIVEDLAASADPSRYRFHACFLKPGPFEQRFLRAGIASRCVHWKGNAKDLPGTVRYISLLRSEKFDLIHQHTGGRFMTGLGRWLTRARLVRTLHFRADERTGAVPDQCNLPESDALIAVSQAVADFSGDSRAVVVYPGVDASHFPAEHRIHEGIVVGTACRLEPVKALHSLLKAVAELVNEFPELRLEIAGDGSLRASLEEESQRLDIASRVRFLGWQQEMAAVLAGWDIFVLPSLDEGFPIAALEAMAAGLPVVASAVGGLNELVRDGETGYLVPAAQPAELAIRLRELIGNPRLRQAMGAAGRLVAQRNYSNTRMVEDTIAVYERVLSQ